MATSEKNGAARAREKTARSKRLYWGFGTAVVAAVLFTFYVSGYVSSQQTYYNERAFRLLSSMADKFALHVKNADNVLRASASFENADQANQYIHKVLHNKVQDHDFMVTRWHKPRAKAIPTREGATTLFLPVEANNFRIRADYREMLSSAEDEKNAKALTPPDKPCDDMSADIVVCATINFDPLVRLSFDDLEEGFFDDILVADSEGNVLYQQSPQGVRIRNLGGVQWLQDSGPAIPSFKSASQTSGPNAGNVFANKIQSSSQSTVVLGDSEYDLFIQPLALSLGEKQDRKLVLCGLRTSKHTRAQTLALPYNYLLWSILILLTIFALGWPVLKFYYMSPKERLQSRQILYLLASILLATALVTVIALNASYQLTSEDNSKRELTRLARQINHNFTAELTSATKMLDTLSLNPSVLEMVQDGNGNRADFLEHHAELCKDCKISYPYFRYFFLAAADGRQLVKFTVNPEPTPWVNVKEEPFFHPVIDDDLSEFQLGDPVKEGELGKEPPRWLRLDPVFSPNTGEFLVILAAPWQQRSSALLKFTKAQEPKVEVLAIKVESLFKPILPTGFGFAVVAPDGKVLFHSLPVRNMNEDFIKEARGNNSLQALFSQGSTGILDINYLGTTKKMWVTPLRAAIHPRLTLVVFKDSADPTTMNMAVVVVFAVLVMAYAILPVFLVVAIHITRRKEYPLEVIWPSCARRSHYLHLVVANLALSVAYFQRYVCYGSSQALFTVLGVAAAAALYPFLECRKRTRVLANVFVLIALIASSGVSWVLGIPALFAVYVFYPRITRLVDHWILNQLSLKVTYTLAAASLLVILVVVPGAGFFKVSYDFTHKLFVQTRQLDLAERLEDRRQEIRDYYEHLNADASFGEDRFRADVDRYDKLFLNCPVISQDSPKRLTSNFVERGILNLTSYFPLNPFAAQLEALARTRRNIPGLNWEIVDKDVFAPDMCTPQVLAASGMRLTPSPTPAVANSPADKKNIAENRETIFTPVPVWPALDWRVRLWLAGAIAGLAVWIHFVPRRLFLLDLERLPPLSEWSPESSEASSSTTPNILLLGPPKSGKRLMVEKLGHPLVLDFAQMATTANWDIPSDCGQVVALNHFEFGIDSAEINNQKLVLLEKLIHVEHKRIILLSAVDPLYYLNAGCPDTVVSGEKKDIPAAIQILDRWALLLSTFRKVKIEESTSQYLYMFALGMRQNSVDPDFLKFVDDVVEECERTAQLRNIGVAILREYPDYKGLSREQVVREVLDRADSYYRVLWAGCTADERLVLYQLSQDGWTNPKNKVAIQQLQRRGLIIIPAQVSDNQPWPGEFASSTLKGSVGIRIMNESFRRFVRSSQQRDEIEAWEREGDQSVWQFLKLSLIILAVAVGAWLLYTQQQFFNAIVAYVGALGAATGIIFKLIGDLRGRGSASSSGS